MLVATNYGMGIHRTAANYRRLNDNETVYSNTIITHNSKKNELFYFVNHSTITNHSEIDKQRQNNNPKSNDTS